jgi:hypothetical protein
VTAVVPRPANRDDVAHIQELVRVGVVGPWHYRWPELVAVAKRLDLRPDDAVWRAHDGTWSPNPQPEPTAADFIREANTR